MAKSVGRIYGSLSISWKMGSVFLLLLFMMGVGGSVGLYNAVRISDVSEYLYNDYFRRVQTLSRAEHEYLLLRQDFIRHLVLAAEPSPSRLDGLIESRRASLDTLLADYRIMGVPPALGPAYEKVEESLSRYIDVQRRAVEALRSGDGGRLRALLDREEPGAFSACLDALGSLTEAEKRSAAQVYSGISSSVAVTKTVTLGLSVAAILIAAGLWYVLTRSIVHPIVTIGEAARDIASGDLKKRIPPLESEDEIGALARRFNTMAEYLQDYYERLEQKVEERTEELRRANEELFTRKHEIEMANMELEEANRHKSQFLANVSHELRTPLNSIIGFSELLQERYFGELNEKQAQYVGFINSSGTHLLELINNILDLSKIEAGRMDVTIDEFPLLEVIGETVDSVKNMAQKKGVELGYRQGDGGPVVAADRAKLKQILINLLSNAVKFNREGGSVYVDWHIREDPKGDATERSLFISVKDTGIGIKQEDRGRLFKEFEQIDPSSTREYGGTGLGLSLTKKLVELHHGEVMVESEFGKGSTFTVRLPQPAANGGGAEPAPAVERPGAETETRRPLILVASESDEINRMLDAYLESESYRVATASDGEDLLVKARSERPFAIVMSVNIPKKDGWDVMKELKSDPLTCEIPVLIITVSDRKELGFALGAVDCLVKPSPGRDGLVDLLSRVGTAWQPRHKRTTILIVNSDGKVLDFLDQMLRGEGFSVITARRGEEALALAQERTPDIIIIDLMLAGLSGFDVIDALKEHPMTREIPVMIFTAKDITEADKEKLGGDIQNILHKSKFKKEDLLSEIHLLEMAYPEKANMVDPLTGLFNRRYFNIVLSRELSRCTRYGHIFSVLLVDIDRFDEFNVSNSYLSGNELIKKLARKLKGNVRKADTVVRLEDDELAVLMPGITADEALKAAEKLRIMVERMSVPAVSGDGKGVTVTIGVIGLPVDGEVDIMEELRRCVRRGLDRGGNRTVVFGR
ncbi:MAG TPA: response regulator [Deltaproteobacteria bacterium]|nr:response regulator [Deltaproteobacteria bacterium]